MNKPHAIVTGSTCEIGGAIVQELNEAGYFVEGWCRAKGIDLTKPETIPYRDCDLVVHVANCTPFGMICLHSKTNISPWGSFILISDVQVLFSQDDYSESKRIQESAIRVIAKNGFRANTLRLGPIYGTKRGAKSDGPGIPMGRVGNPEDVAKAVCFMAASQWMCGATVTLDGGMSLLAPQQ